MGSFIHVQSLRLLELLFSHVSVIVCVPHYSWILGQRLGLYYYFVCPPDK